VVRTPPQFCELYWLSFTSSATSYNITTTKEVILSAGSIASAQLLLLSGIGPSAALISKRIPVKYNNPNVGANLVVSG
jgi:choline dehydrogenase-like flavoprotein